MVFNQIKKVIRMDRWDIVKFQMLLYCHLNNISVTEQGLSCITLLGINGEQELSSFCDEVAAKKIFRNSQSVRTALASFEKKGLITTFKPGTGKKRVKINDKILIETTGNILLDLKVVNVES